MEVCIKKVSTLPSDYQDVKNSSDNIYPNIPMTLSPNDLSTLANRVYDDDRSQDSISMRFYEKMCQNCKKDKCDITCRNDLYCKLSNANQDDIINCRKRNFVDEEYGL